MRNRHGFTDQSLRTLGASLERGREAVSAIMAVAPYVMGSSRRRPSSSALTRVTSIGPLWIGVGVAAGLASMMLNHRRHRTRLDGQDRRQLRDVMITDVHTIEPGATVVEAAEYMRQKNVGVLPVVEDGEIVGVITDRDLVVRALAQHERDLTTMRVRDCATKNPILAKASWTPERALLIMADQQIGRLPVVDDQGHLVGMVTLSSLALRSRKPDETLAAAKQVSLRSARDEAA
jgi:CBS domain-containing protein